MSVSKTKALRFTKAGNFNQFRVSKLSGSVRERAEFDPQRRQEVNAVRKMRACLRCSLLKIKCSCDNPCTTCEQLAFVLHAAHEKQKLPFSGCIRTRLYEVSVFEAYIPPPNVQRLVQTKIKNLALTMISLDFASQVTWDLRALVNDIFNWFNDSMVSVTSKVGTLSSPQFLDLIKSSIKENTRINFQCMIYTISLAYTQPTATDRDHLSVEELYQIGSVAGHGLLKELDERLKPQSLNDCSDNDLRALFLLVIGTILAVGYTKPEISSKLAPEQYSQFKAMQYHLCQILAHYVIYLGSQLKLPIASGADEFILKAAPVRWHKEGVFQWRTSHGNDSTLDTEDEWAFGNLNHSFLGNRVNSDSGICSLHSKITRRRRPRPREQAQRPACVSCFVYSHEMICRSCMKTFSLLTPLLPKYLMRENQLCPDHLPTSWCPPAQVIDQSLLLASGNDGFVHLTELYANKADFGGAVGIEPKKQCLSSLPRVPRTNATTTVSAVLQHQNAPKSTNRFFFHEPLSDLPSRLPNCEGPQTYKSHFGYDDYLPVGNSDHAFTNQFSAYQHDLVQQKHFSCTDYYKAPSSGYSDVDEMYLSLSDDLPERDPSIRKANSELSFSMEWKSKQLMDHCNSGASQFNGILCPKCSTDVSRPSLHPSCNDSHLYLHTSRKREMMYLLV